MSRSKGRLTVLQVPCQQCGREMAVPEVYADRSIRCPRCGFEFVASTAFAHTPSRVDSDPVSGRTSLPDKGSIFTRSLFRGEAGELAWTTLWCAFALPL